MRINLPSNMPQTTGETPVKSSENSENGTASAFFVQMDHILNTDAENKDQGEENTSVHQVDMQCNDPMSLALNASLLSIQSVMTQPAQGLSLSDAIALFQFAQTRGSLDESNPKPAAATPNISDSSGRSTPGIVGSSESVPTGIGLTEQVTTNGFASQNVVSPQVKSSDPEPSQLRLDSHVLPQTLTEEISQVILTAQEQPPGMRDPSVENLTDSLRAMGFIHKEMPAKEIVGEGNASTESFKTALESNFKLGGNGEILRTLNESSQTIPSDKLDIKSAPKDNSDNSRLDTNWARTISLESDQGLSLRLGSRPVEENSTFAGNNLLSKDANPKSENSQSAAVSRENLVQAATENLNAGDTHTDSNASRNASFSWMAPQIKLESAQLDSGRPRSSTTEIKQEVSLVTSSGSARVVESSSHALASPEKAAASQSQDLIFQIAERIQIQLRDGRGEIRIQLKPDNLGSLEIRAESTVNGVVARITTETSSVKSYLENNLHLLQQNLQDQGLKIDRIQVVVQDGTDPQSSSGTTTQSGHTGSGQPERNLHEPAEAQGGPAEELTVDPTTWITLNPEIRFHTIA